MDALLRILLGNALLVVPMAVLAFLVGRWGRRPALTHTLWLVVLLKLVTPPLWEVSVPGIQFASHSAASGALADDAVVADLSSELVAEDPRETPTIMEERPLPPDVPEMMSPPVARVETPAEVRAVEPPVGTALDWRWPLVAVWIIGTACWLAVTLSRVGRFTRLLRFARPASPDLLRRIRHLSAEVGLRLRLDILLVPGRISPMVWPLSGRPILLLPQELLDRLSEEQQASLLLHELAHLRRHDHWCRLLELLVTALYWWHPVVWWARHAMREAEEACCDAWVVWAMPDAGRAYATALVETVDFLSETRPALPPAASGIGEIRDLRRRVTMIMRGTTPRALGRAGFLSALGLAATLLPIFPSNADEPERQPTSREGRREGIKEIRPSEGPPPEVREAMERLERARAEFERARQQMMEAQERLEQAGIRLRERAGRPERPGEAERRPEREGIRRDVERRDVERREGERREGERREGDRPVGRGPEMDRRQMEIERRLEALMREVDMLRSELRRGYDPRPIGREPDRRAPEPTRPRSTGERPDAPPAPRAREGDRPRDEASPRDALPRVPAPPPPPRVGPVPVPPGPSVPAPPPAPRRDGDAPRPPARDF